MKNPLIEFFKSKIISRAALHGITLNIGYLRMQGINSLRLANIIVSKNKNYIVAEEMVMRLSFFQSLINWSIYGELEFININSRIDIISKIPIIIPSIGVIFNLRKNKMLANIDIDNLCTIVQWTKKRRKTEFLIQINETKWNDLLAPFRDLFMTDWMKSIYSESTFTLCAYYQRVEKMKVWTSSFNASLKTSSLDISYLDNKNFVFPKVNIQIPLDQISKYVINGIVSTEDPQFWQHKGICIPFIELAINENIDKKQIKRGGSTITMQLMRNLFLTHDRNFMRKIEESLLALLMENYYHISKEQILEIYLNIIEFAPNVYGLSDACRFYFAKEQSELSFVECLILTYIIPRPKHFYDALLNKSEKLRQNLYNHIELYASNLFMQGQISIEEYKSIEYNIVFTKPFGVLNLNPYHKVKAPINKALWMTIAWSECNEWKKHGTTVYDPIGYAYAKKYIISTGEHLSPTTNGWCGCFVDWVLKKTNQLYGTQLPTVTTNPSSSQNYACQERYPIQLVEPSLDTPQYGSIVILHSSGWQGHVGFIVNFLIDSKRRYAYILGGNQYDKVCIQKFEVYARNKEVIYKTENNTLFILKGYVYPSDKLSSDIQ